MLPNGHVGKLGCVFPLQSIGVEGLAVQTVQFLQHPGYGAWRGTVSALKSPGGQGSRSAVCRRMRWSDLRISRMPDAGERSGRIGGESEGANRPALLLDPVIGDVSQGVSCAAEFRNSSRTHDSDRGRGHDQSI